MTGLNAHYSFSTPCQVWCEHRFAAWTKSNNQTHPDVCSLLFDSPDVALEQHPSTSISHCPLYIDTTVFLSLQEYLKLIIWKDKNF